MSKTKATTHGNWAPPPKQQHTPSRSLTGRVIFGMLTGDEGPESKEREPDAKPRR